MTRRTGVVLLGVLAAAALAAPTPALAQGSGWAFRYHIGYFIPTDEFETTEPAGTSKATFQNEIGVGLSAEYLFNERFGLEVGAKYFKPSVRSAGPGVPTAEKRLEIIPVTLGALYHFGGETYQFYGGVEAAYIDYGQISAPNYTTFDSEFTLGLKLGVDVPFNNAWAFSGTVEYLFAQAQIDDPTGAELQPMPVIVSLGATYRF